MWNQHFMVRTGLPRTTNAVEAWHRSFGCHMSCHHPSMWRLLNKLKEQGLVEVKQAFTLPVESLQNVGVMVRGKVH